MTFARRRHAQRHAKKRLALILLGGVAGVAVGLAGVYGIGRLDRQCGGRSGLQGRGGNRPPDGAAGPRRGRRRLGRQGAQKPAGAGLQGRQRGREDRSPTGAAARVLLNLWATWCVPCRKEMPALDALQGKLGGRRLRGRLHQHRHPRPRQAEGLAEGGRRQHARLLRRQQRQGVPGPQGDRQGLRHADHADRRSERLRACDAWPGRRNGRATTRSSSSPRRSGSKATPHHAVMSRLPPTPLATLARRLKFCCAASSSLAMSAAALGIHAQHLGRHRLLQLTDLGGDEGCCDRTDVHTLNSYSSSGA